MIGRPDLSDRAARIAEVHRDTVLTYGTVLLWVEPASAEVARNAALSQRPEGNVLHSVREKRLLAVRGGADVATATTANGARQHSESTASLGTRHAHGARHTVGQRKITGDLSERIAQNTEHVALTLLSRFLILVFCRSPQGVLLFSWESFCAAVEGKSRIRETLRDR